MTFTRLSFFSVVLLVSLSCNVMQSAVPEANPAAESPKSTNYDFFSRAFGPRLFKDVLNVDTFKKDLEFIRNLKPVENVRGLRDPEQKVILYSVFYHYFLNIYRRSEDPEGLAESLRHELDDLDVELKNEMLASHIRDFSTKKKKQPTTDDMKKIERKASQHYKDMFRMQPQEKYELLQLMEDYYTRTADEKEPEEVREVRQQFFDWAQEMVLEEISQAKLVIKRSKGKWARYRDLVVKAAVLIGLGYGAIQLRKALRGEEPLRGMPRWHQVGTNEIKYSQAIEQMWSFTNKVYQAGADGYEDVKADALNVAIRKKKKFPSAYQNKLMQILQENGIHDWTMQQEVIEDFFNKYFDDQRIAKRHSRPVF